MPKRPSGFSHSRLALEYLESRLLLATAPYGGFAPPHPHHGPAQHGPLQPGRGGADRPPPGPGAPQRPPTTIVQSVVLTPQNQPAARAAQPPGTSAAELAVAEVAAAPDTLPADRVFADTAQVAGIRSGSEAFARPSERGTLLPSPVGGARLQGEARQVRFALPTGAFPNAGGPAGAAQRTPQQPDVTNTPPLAKRAENNQPKARGEELAPDAVGLLAGGVGAGLAALEQTVDSLADVEQGGIRPILLYALGLGSWVLGASLAWGAFRRRQRQALSLQTPHQLEDLP